MQTSCRQGTRCIWCATSCARSWISASSSRPYTEARGFPPYNPGMMVALLLYAYSQGVHSSRRIARGCEERLDFKAVTAPNRPNFRPISEFRRRHLTALGELFVQVLALCQKAGLVGLGHVAVDGTKLRGNASKHKAMSYEHMVKAESELAAEVKSWLDQAGEVDATQDAEHGLDTRGDETPDWMANKQQRLARIREARAALEAVNSRSRLTPSVADASPVLVTIVLAGWVQVSREE